MLFQPWRSLDALPMICFLHLRLEQPGSSMLWLLPEMAKFLEVTAAVRVHSWMRCFGHPMPKPSVFMSNMASDFVNDLHRSWSKKMEKLWSSMLTQKLLKTLALRKLWHNKAKVCRTALRFHTKNKLVKDSKCYYRIHRSKSMNRKFVTGGKHLKDSGVYTVRFCEAVLHVWFMSAGARMEGFSGPLTTNIPFKKIWRDTFATSTREEDSFRTTKTFAFMFQFFKP